jgi:hypothetical protein
MGQQRCSNGTGDAAIVTDPLSPSTQCAGQWEAAQIYK